MKKLRFKEKMSARAGSKLFFLLAFMGMMLTTEAVVAQTFSVSECVCMNNQTISDEGLFEENIVVNGGGAGPWTVVSAVGYYDTASMPGNLIAIPQGTMLLDMGGGQFSLPGVREDGDVWDVVLTNGMANYPLSSLHRCEYPGPELIGDLSVCLNTSDSYTIDGDPARVINPMWSLPNGGTIVGPTNTPSVVVDWGNVSGLATLSVTGMYQAYPGQGSNQCAINIDQDIPIEPANQSVPMACNNRINISMNNQCELYITADMVLEDMQFGNDSYEIQLRDIDRDTIIPNGVISMEYLDKIIEVSVIHECSGNSCWGHVLLEDKNIPELICNPDTTINCDELSDPEVTGFPVPDDATVNYERPGVYTVLGFDKCTALTLRYEDRKEGIHCDSIYSSIITRYWSIMDDAGNTDTCSSRIYILKATLGSITFPENYDDVLGPNPSLEACSGYPTLPNGYPDPYHPNGTGSPQGTFCLNVLVDFVDIHLPKCGDGKVSFKILRKWTITDLCTGMKESRTQTISVKDNNPPICAAQDEFTVGTVGQTCGSNIDVPAPLVLYECSPWDYTVAYKLRDDSGDAFTDATTDGVVRNNDGTYRITSIPPGQDSVWIVYTITDECDNSTQCFTEAAIKDNLPPEPVCDQNSFVALNADGVAWAGVLTFDDGSHDNCMIDKMEIRRMNASPCGEPNLWSDKIKFCCADVGVETMVSLRVTDKAGNQNTCMVFVQVQDNQPPVLVNCPKDVTVNCNADLYNLGAFGQPDIEDLCGATLSEAPPVRNINNCGVGTVERTFIATDKSGNTATCSQTIYVQATNPFRASDIRWPADHTVTNGCMDSGIHPDDLPSNKRYPAYPEKPCSNVTHDYNDVVFQFTDGACFKILREWTVLDWCAFNGITGAGIYKHTQVIMVQNSIKPTIIAGCRDQDLQTTDLGDCRSRVILTAEGQDDCSLPTSLRWSYQMDVGNDGSVDFTGNSKTINRVIDHGTFKVTWTVTDECDNSSTCSKVFTVNDTKKPTPYCLTEIVTVIMQTTKEVTIWASDFDRNSFDNCTPQEDLRFSFSPNVNDTSRTFDCEDLEDGEALLDINMYVTDLSNNQDFCAVRIRIQDNSDNCEDDIIRVGLGGKITNESAGIVGDIQVRLAADLPEFPRVHNLDNGGQYAFEDLIMYTDYSLSPRKDGNDQEGISTLDLVMIQRHILGIQHLASAYKVIAADVNGDQKISASDLVELRKLILGVTAQLPKDNWRFIDAQKTFTDPVKPFPYTSGATMYGLDHSVDNMNFVALKVGDVNNSHTSNLTNGSLDTRSQKEWTLKESLVNGLAKVSVEVEESGLAGFQFAVEFDPEVYNFEGIEAKAIDFNEGNMGLSLLDEGKIFISWNALETVDVSGELLTILLSAKGSPSEGQGIQINPGLLAPEAYTIMGDVETSELSFRWEDRIEDFGFELFQNIPNPFSKSTTIGFSLKNESSVTLKVFDYSGKILFQRSGYFQRGYNSIEIQAEDLQSTSGLMYYQLDTEAHSLSKKMIHVK